MKILLLTTHLNYGGISSYTVSLAKSLKKRGHTVFCFSSSGTLVSHLKKNNLHHGWIPINTKSELSPFVAVSALSLLGFIKRESIEIIHAQTRVTQVLAEILSRMTKVPYVSTCHGFFKPNFGRRILPCWGKKVIAISDAVKQHLMDDFNVPENNIVLIPNGIDVDSFRVCSKRTDINYPDRKVGIIARISYVKGHEYLIKAMAQVLKKYPDAQLFIFGQGKIKYDLIRLAEKLKINDNIFFLPSVSNPADVLQEMDIFVMPSIQEGLGLSILEAQACGLAVVASDVGGIPTVIKDNLTGLLVEPKDAQGLADAIMKLMGDKELAIKLGQKARLEVESKFSLQVMAEKVEKAYKEVIG